MMAGLGLLQFFCFFLTKTAQQVQSDFAHVYELFGVVLPLKNRNRISTYSRMLAMWTGIRVIILWAMMTIGALGFIGYLDAIAHFLFGQISPTLANISIGLSSAFIDNDKLMFAVLSMHPDLPPGQWLLLTLTLGVGGSLLAIGSAPGVALLGQIKEGYTFAYHRRWMPVILLGYFASIARAFLDRCPVFLIRFFASPPPSGEFNISDLRTFGSLNSYHFLYLTGYWKAIMPCDFS